MCFLFMQQIPLKQSTLDFQASDEKFTSCGDLAVTLVCLCVWTRRLWWITHLLLGTHWMHSEKHFVEFHSAGIVDVFAHFQSLIPKLNFLFFSFSLFLCSSLVEIPFMTSIIGRYVCCCLRCDVLLFFVHSLFYFVVLYVFLFVLLCCFFTHPFIN